MLTRSRFTRDIFEDESGNPNILPYYPKPPECPPCESKAIIAPSFGTECLILGVVLLFILFLVIIIVFPINNSNLPIATGVHMVLPSDLMFDNGSSSLNLLIDSLLLKKRLLIIENNDIIDPGIWGKPVLMFANEQGKVDSGFCINGRGGFTVISCTDNNKDNVCSIPPTSDTNVAAITFCNVCMDYSSNICNPNITYPSTAACCDYNEVTNPSAPRCNNVNISSYDNRGFYAISDLFNGFTANLSPVALLPLVTEFTPHQYQATRSINDGFIEDFSQARHMFFLHKYKVPNDTLSLLRKQVEFIPRPNAPFGIPNREKVLSEFAWEIVFSLFISFNFSETFNNPNSPMEQDATMHQINFAVYDWSESTWRHLGTMLDHLEPFPGSYGFINGSTITQRGMPEQGFEYTYGLNGTSLFDYFVGGPDDSIWVAWEGPNDQFFLIDYIKLCLRQVSVIEPLPLRFPLTPPPDPTANGLGVESLVDMSSGVLFGGTQKYCLSFNVSDMSPLNLSLFTYDDQVLFNCFFYDGIFTLNISNYLNITGLKNRYNLLGNGALSNLFEIKTSLSLQFDSNNTNSSMPNLLNLVTPSNDSDSNNMPWRWDTYPTYQPLLPRLALCLVNEDDDTWDLSGSNVKSCPIGREVKNIAFGSDYAISLSTCNFMDTTLLYLPNTESSNLLLKIKLKATYIPTELRNKLVNSVVTALSVCIKPIGL